MKVPPDRDDGWRSGDLQLYSEAFTPPAWLERGPALTIKPGVSIRATTQLYADAHGTRARIALHLGEGTGPAMTPRTLTKERRNQIRRDLGLDEVRP